MTARRDKISRTARAASVAALAGEFLLHVVLSGTLTAWRIVRPWQRPSSGLVRITYGDLNETGAAILGCLLNLTPGSTAIDIDPERHELLLHLLDVSQPEGAFLSLVRLFEGRLRPLFPDEAAS